MNRRLPLVVVNPAARAGAAGRAWASAAPTVRAHLGPYECVFTRFVGDATRRVEEQARAGRRFFVTFGGDGTISEVARGILRSRTPAELGLLPQGTGADFLRTLGGPRRLADAAHGLRHGNSRVIDVGCVHLVGDRGDRESRYFINGASFGLSSEVAERTNRANRSGRRRRMGGKIAYATQTVGAAFGFEPPDIWLQTDGGLARHLTITQLSVSNGIFFGGGMKIAPRARLVDGRLDLVIVRKLSVARILADGPRLYTGTHLSLPEVEHQHVTSVRAWPVMDDANIRLEVDGETPGRLPAAFEVHPGALIVRVPRPV